MDQSFKKPPAIDLVRRRTTYVALKGQETARLSMQDLYVLMIQRWTDNERLDANKQPLSFLTPLLELRINQFQTTAAQCYHKFTYERASSHAESAFDSSWRPMRDAILEASHSFEAFDQYDLCHANGDVQKSFKFQRLLKRFTRVLTNASRMEQHIRDDLQLQVGHLSLEESRESIKQSKVALEESKRVKMRMYLHPGEG